MITKYCRAEDENAYVEAAEIIKRGGLVAFPTETVYGLGANALDPVAVKKIYEAKGRPSDNPLIVHISALDQLGGVVSEINDNAKKLMDNFWPGPLTIIFNKNKAIPFATSGGLSTVAVRFPQNKTAQKFISACGLPIAAPSANTSGKPSPTSAEHVKADLDGKIDMIIDGGSSDFGLESTIVDITGKDAVLLRPGSITREMLERAIGKITTDRAVVEEPKGDFVPRAPGMKYKHYSPLCSIIIVKGEDESVNNKIRALLAEDKAKGINSGLIATKEDCSLFSELTLIEMGSDKDEAAMASQLFNALRSCDTLKLDKAYVKAVSEDGLGLAIMNRLKKAAGYNIIEA